MQQPLVYFRYTLWEEVENSYQLVGAADELSVIETWLAEMKPFITGKRRGYRIVDTVKTVIREGEIK